MCSARIILHAETPFCLQTAYYCNVSGDSRLAVGAFFPLTVNVPVGVSSKVIFANITGVIPGTNSTGGGGSGGSSSGCSSVVQQPGKGSTQLCFYPSPHNI